MLLAPLPQPPAGREFFLVLRYLLGDMKGLASALGITVSGTYKDPTLIIRSSDYGDMALALGAPPRDALQHMARLMEGTWGAGGGWYALSATIAKGGLPKAAKLADIVQRQRSAPVEMAAAARQIRAGADGVNFQDWTAEELTNLLKLRLQGTKHKPGVLALLGPADVSLVMFRSLEARVRRGRGGDECNSTLRDLLLRCSRHRLWFLLLPSLPHVARPCPHVRFRPATIPCMALRGCLRRCGRASSRCTRRARRR